MRVPGFEAAGDRPSLYDVGALASIGHDGAHDAIWDA
jgi:hypothetical protein